MSNETIGTKAPPVADSRPQMTEAEATHALEHIITCIAVVTRGPQDALSIAMEVVAQLATAFDVTMLEMSHSFMKLHEEKPPTKEDRDASRALVVACHNGAQRVRGDLSDVRAALQKMQQERAKMSACANCGRQVSEHELPSQLCDGFKSWGAGGSNV